LLLSDKIKTLNIKPFRTPMMYPAQFRAGYYLINCPVPMGRHESWK